MKHGDIRSVAHSIADSLACGVSLMTGFYDLRVYEERRAFGRWHFDHRSVEWHRGHGEAFL